MKAKRNEINKQNTTGLGGFTYKGDQARLYISNSFVGCAHP